mgnify:CR=1 FL=1
MQAVTATIGKGAFANCTGLVKLTLPATLDKLSDNAFYGRDTMAMTVTMCRDYGLRLTMTYTCYAQHGAGCTALVELTLPAAMTR